jgi:hypothetical protein
MSLPTNPASPGEDDAPPPLGDVWMEPEAELEELDDDDEPTDPGGLIRDGLIRDDLSHDDSDFSDDEPTNS